MVLRPSRAGLASDLRRVIAVGLRCGDNGGYGGHHEFRNFLAQPITSKRNITVLPSRSKFFLIHQHLQRSAQALAGLIGLDDIVKVPEHNVQASLRLQWLQHTMQRQGKLQRAQCITLLYTGS